MNPVDEKWALTFVRKWLAALRDYPEHEAGQKCLAMYLSRYALSIEHAEAILKAFRDQCPTPQDLHDVAYNDALRAQFLPKQPPLKEQWLRAGYTLDAGFYDSIQEQLGSRKPGEPRQDDLMWKAIKKKLAVREFSKVPLGQCWAIAEELGFPLSGEQREELARWRLTHPKEDDNK